MMFISQGIFLTAEGVQRLANFVARKNFIQVGLVNLNSHGIDGEVSALQIFYDRLAPVHLVWSPEVRVNSLGAVGGDLQRR